MSAVAFPNYFVVFVIFLTKCDWTDWIYSDLIHIYILGWSNTSIPYYKLVPKENLGFIHRENHNRSMT